MGFLRYQQQESGADMVATFVPIDIGWLISFVLMGWYFRRRNVPYIASRSPIWMLTLIIALVLPSVIILQIFMVYPTVLCEDGIGRSVAPFVFWIGNSSFLCMFSCMIWRCLELIQRFEVQRMRLALRLHEDGYITSAEPTLEMNWFQRHIAWIASRPVAVVLILYTVVPAAIVMANPSARSFTLRDDGQCITASPVILYASVIAALVLCALAWKVRSVTDGFRIVVELKRLGLIAIWYVIMTQAFSAGDTKFSYSLGWLFLVSATAHFPMVGFCIGVPLYESYYPPKARQSSTAIEHQRLIAQHHNTGANASRRHLALTPTGADGARSPHASQAHGVVHPHPPLPINRHGSASHIPSTSDRGVPATFQEILRSIPGRRAFEKHLTYEFSLESLLFLNDVEALRALTRPVAPPSPLAPSANATASGATTPPTALTSPKNGPALGNVDVPVAEARARATAIYQKYVADTATHEINLSSQLTTALRRVFRPKERKVATRASLFVSNSSGGLSALAAAARGLPRTSGPTGEVAGGPNARGSLFIPTPRGAKPNGTASGGITPGVSAPPGVTVLPTVGEHKSGGGGTGTTGSAYAVPMTVTVNVNGEKPKTHSSDRPPSANAWGDKSEFDPRPATFWVSVFDAAYEEVYKLLETDSFPRFLGSALYDELVRNALLAHAMITNVEINPAELELPAAAKPRSGRTSVLIPPQPTTTGSALRSPLSPTSANSPSAPAAAGGPVQVLHPTH